MALTFNKITVFGAGTMGAGIAQVCATAGIHVTVCDPSPEAAKRAQKQIDADLRAGVEAKRLSREQESEIRARIRYVSGMGDCGDADLVIEAVFERLDVKQELFVRLDAQLKPPTVLATNTSSLSVTSIAAKTRFSDRVCGLHFFNPPTRMKLVEVVAAQQTSTEVISRCVSFIKEIGKEPAKVQDTPGFIVNRCARPFYGEALRCLGEGVADIKTIDQILREGGGFKMGAFELIDMIGVDINYATTRSIWEGYFHDLRFRPHLIQKKMVEAGRLGRKSGRGFYEYPNAG
ncbi:MAG TPA: 3-hydroxyacyl-CoA dehydrogenase NAD-binding domain-containing protein [bacterium]|jgi:3-hydroxybutyryl-CoA dehydrogenase